jgi:hypothetical protein
MFIIAAKPCVRPLNKHYNKNAQLTVFKSFRKISGSDY